MDHLKLRGLIAAFRGSSHRLSFGGTAPHHQESNAGNEVLFQVEKNKACLARMEVLDFTKTAPRTLNFQSFILFGNELTTKVLSRLPKPRDRRINLSHQEIAALVMAISDDRMFSFLWQEIFLVLALGVGIVVLTFETPLTEAGPTSALIATFCIIAAIVAVSMRVAHRAEVIASKVGDPYGTMVLTMSAVGVEVLILIILMNGSGGSPTLARDTIFSAVMLDINGILGLAALLGGWKYGEQAYNDDSGKTYGVMILTAMGISMVVPEFIPEEKRRLYSVFTVGIMATLYWVFLRNQIGQHSYFFNYSYPEKKTRGGRDRQYEPFALSIAVLVVGVLLIGFLAEVMSAFLSHGLQAVGAPIALAALVVAVMSAAPEFLTALRAALANRMQVVINIALGASLSTVILTVPVIEGVALFTDQPIIMAMTPIQTMMIAITLVAAAINLNDGQTNAIEGMTHFVLFVTFLALSFLGVAGG